MSEHRLYEADVGTVLQHVCGHRMPKAMAGAFDLDPGLSDVTLDAFADGTASKGGCLCR
jgi:hypothetical protein